MLVACPVRALDDVAIVVTQTKIKAQWHSSRNLPLIWRSSCSNYFESTLAHSDSTWVYKWPQVVCWLKAQNEHNILKCTGVLLTLHYLIPQNMGRVLLSGFRGQHSRWHSPDLVILSLKIYMYIFMNIYE